MEYYYTDGTTNFGPFTLEQLREKNITASTKVWYSGLSSWKPAGEIPELAGILSAGGPPNDSPPQVHRAPSYQAVPGPAPKSWFVESILVTLFCCQPFGVVGIVYAALVESAISTGNLTEANRLSQQAGKWTKIAFFCGLAFYVLFGLLYGTILMTALRNVPDFQGF